MESPVTEIAIYRIKQESLPDFPALSKQVQDYLSSVPGFIERKVLTDPNDPALFSDILLWTDAAVAKEVQNSAMGVESLQGFFSATESVVHFNFYTDYK